MPVNPELTRWTGPHGLPRFARLLASFAAVGTVAALLRRNRRGYCAKRGCGDQCRRPACTQDGLQIHWAHSVQEPPHHLRIVFNDSPTSSGWLSQV